MLGWGWIAVALAPLTPVDFCSCSGSAGEGPAGLAALEIREQAQALVLGGADRATASDQTSGQSADNLFWMDSSPAGPTQPGHSLPGRGHQGWCLPASLCPWPVLEVEEWLGPSPEGPCKHFTSCPSWALIRKPSHTQRSF